MPVGETRNRLPRHHVGKKLLTVLLTLLFFGLSMAITLNLKHVGEDRARAQNHLQSFITEVTVQEGFEYQAIGGRSPLQEVREELAASRRRAGDHLAEAVPRGLPAGVADQLAELTNRYSRIVDEEVRLLSLGQNEAAMELDETQVDPTFDEVSTLLASTSAQLEIQARNTQSLSDVGVLLTMLLSLIVVSVVQSRRRREEVRNQTEREGEARYRTLIDQSSDLVMVLDRTGRADFASPSVERLLAPVDQGHLDAVEAFAIPSPIDFVAAVDPLDRARFSTALQTAAPGSASSGEFRVTGRHGTSTFQVSVQDLTAEPSVGGLVLNAHDVTERLALQSEMEHRALHDALTGLPNRALLADRFDQALRGAERAGTRVGLLLLDLDRFKEVNDTFGHHHGDLLLCQIGLRLAGALRGVDTIARLGGDEFAVLLRDVHRLEDATKVATALLAALTSPFHIEGVEMDVEASVGVVISGEHGHDAITLMQRADVAMYAAKAQHVGVFAYEPGVDGHSATKLAMAGELRRALEGNELVLYYQPKVSMDTAEVVGVEALVRWQHPERGLLFPDDFIPLAENTGLINPLTAYVLDAALARARAWLDAGRPLQVAVNLSARNLHDERFAELVARLLAAHGVPAALLQLEVTESAIMIDPVRARAMLGQLSALGVRISIDDFGAGYTSLGQLTTMPISELKIDRSFVMMMTQDPSNALIVSSVVDLGHNLGLTLVAEGVETEEALTALAGMDCDVAQGYHLCRPIPAEAFDIWCAGRTITPMTSREHPSAPVGSSPGG